MADTHTDEMRSILEVGSESYEDIMIRGVLVTNAFLRTQKFVTHYEWLKEAAKKRNMELSLCENADFILELPIQNECTDSMQKIEKELLSYDFVLYWDKDIRIGRLLEELCSQKRIPFYNPLTGIAVCDDKAETYLQLWKWNRAHDDEENIPILPTIIAPMTYGNIGYTDISFTKKVIQSLGLPLVIKECFGSFGMQVYLASTEEEVIAITKKLAGTPFLYQKFIQESLGKDVRLQVVGNQVVAAMCRTAQKGDFRANVSNGGSMEKYEPTKRECALAVRTANALGLTFAGVDLLFSKGTDKEADIVCEVNSNAHFENIHTCTGVNVAEAIIDEIAARL